MSEIAIIGGTSLQRIKALKIHERKKITTNYGEPSSPIAFGELNGKDVLFLNRHGDAYQLPPHKINYRSNIDSLAQLGVKKIIAVNAVGGIASFAKPLHLSVPNQIIDYTYGRQHTYFEGGESGVNFIEFSSPFSKTLSDKLISSAKALGFDNNEKGFSENTCYGCTQGPRLETAAEIKRMARDGCDLVGMTMMPEAALAREKNIEYASLCLVVNWAAGLSEEPITMEEISRLIELGSESVESVLRDFVKRI